MATETNYQVLKPDAHAELALLTPRGYGHMAAISRVPVVANELRQVARHYLTAFLVGQGSAGEGPELVALLGHTRGENLYLMPDGRWLGDHVPAYCRGYPFAALSAGERRVLTLDVRASCVTHVRDEGAQALFDDQRRPTALLQRYMEWIERRERGRQALRRAGEALQRLGLLTPWRPESDTFPEFHADLYSIDEPALGRLGDAQLGELRDANALPVIYAHLMSLANVDRLARRLALRQRQQQAADPLADGEVAFEEEEWTFDFDD